MDTAGDMKRCENCCEWMQARRHYRVRHFCSLSCQRAVWRSAGQAILKQRKPRRDTQHLQAKPPRFGLCAYCNHEFNLKWHRNTGNNFCSKRCSWRYHGEKRRFKEYKAQYSTAALEKRRAYSREYNHKNKDILNPRIIIRRSTSIKTIRNLGITESKLDGNSAIKIIRNLGVNI